jgi:hypothetical protein
VVDGIASVNPGRKLQADFAARRRRSKGWAEVSVAASRCESARPSFSSDRVVTAAVVRVPAAALDPPAVAAHDPPAVAAHDPVAEAVMAEAADTAAIANWSSNDFSVSSLGPERAPPSEFGLFFCYVDA